MKNIIMDQEVSKILEAYYTDRFNAFLEKMPNGEFLNKHNDKTDKCDGLVMIASGDICPVGYNSIWSLNKLFIAHDHTTVCLSTYSIAGNFSTIGKTLEQSVKEYNNCLFTNIEPLPFYGRNAIVAYHSFRKDW